MGPRWLALLTGFAAATGGCTRDASTDPIGSAASSSPSLPTGDSSPPVTLPDPPVETVTLEAEGCDDAAWSTDLPLLVIDTGGRVIEDDDRIVAMLGIIDNGPGARNCLEQFPTDYLGRISIEYRGSTSQNLPKKSYGFETQRPDGSNNNVSLLGLPSENDWVLYAPYSDKTMVRNVLAYGLYAEMGRYAVRTRYTELVINGDYLGVFVLTEKVKIDADRVDLARLLPEDVAGDALTGGYLIKVDKHTGDGDEFWVSAHGDRYDFQYHDPSEDELVPEQKAYIQSVTAGFEDALFGPDFADPDLGYPAWIDVDAFVDFMIMQELGRTVDGYRSSTFLYKDRDSIDPRLRMGPMWDFNVSFGHANYCDAWQTSGWQWDFNQVCPTFETQIPGWWRRLLEDPAYRDRLQCRWQELRAGAFATEALHARIDAAVDTLREAHVRNFQRWPIIGVYIPWNPFVGQTWEEDIDYLRSWLAERAETMDDTLPGSCAPGP